MWGRALVLVTAATFIALSASGQQTTVPPSNAPQTETGSYISIPLPLTVAPDGQLRPQAQGAPFTVTPDTVWLNVKGHSNCYYLYDEHYFEANTSTQKGGGAPVNVNSIAMTFRIAGDTGSQTCPNTSICAKTIKEYNLYCRSPRSIYATATYNGVSWSAGTSW
jgi:hypothetical protein